MKISKKCPEIDSLREAIQNGKEVMAFKIMEADGLYDGDKDFIVSYARNAIVIHDRLVSVAAALDKIEAELWDIENSSWCGGFFVDSNAEKVSRAFNDLLGSDKPGIDERDKVEIKITEGMIRQNLLTFTKPIKKGKLKAGQKMILETKSEIVESEIIQPGNKLRERGAVGRLYRESHAQPNDLLILTRIGQKEENRWQVTIKPHVKPLIL
ncbi:hypothetical protein M2103_002562 [Ereboglobus sp. PH5-5]|uniref:hypothetical protein n=1 Tax=Ereboglobus sp. PH5-5 TaxID=2940529 RepID=UPI0024061861|nr:hypothetical protein [Ereboglobus sp. PH5-5]MDF9834317.1 hypothetical protein [Ereboglobus sp. PH5-5]